VVTSTLTDDDDVFFSDSALTLNDMETHIEEAQDFATKWLWAYNNDRPNMGIGGITLAQKLKMAV
jgi:transposase InsO family protein